MTDRDAQQWTDLVRKVVRDCLGVEPDRIDAIEGQLGLRRFARVHLPGAKTLIARVEAPEDPAGRPSGVPPEPPLEPIRALMAEAGLPVPARLGADEAAGVELLEDFGNRSLRDAASGASAEERRDLYREACALVPRLQRIPKTAGVAAFDRRLDDAHFAYKADLFVRWAVPERGREASPAEIAAIAEIFGRIGRITGATTLRLAHRDFQSANLLLRDGPERLGMIDLQGALLAPPEYDLVCLLRDSYVELDETEITDHLETIRSALPDPSDAETFLQRFDLLTLTRKGKDLARYLYAARSRGDARFLRYVPATIRGLRAAAKRAASADPFVAPLTEIIASLPESPCAR